MPKIFLFLQIHLWLCFAVKQDVLAVVTDSAGEQSLLSLPISKILTLRKESQALNTVIINHLKFI
jgi:hypothetical protein